ncbi:NGG1p interacting factor NIF3 [Ferrimonas balearica]|nr:NGG1p interacting factor NIF3 [Ferrimonas balearica]
MKKLEVYVPASHLEGLLTALFEAGAGRLGDYDQCCWVSEGRGQYRPLPSSAPFLGTVGKLHREPEHKVELVFDAALKDTIIAALKTAHPYQTPAYQVLAFEL